MVTKYDVDLGAQTQTMGARLLPNTVPEPSLTWLIPPFVPNMVVANTPAWHHEAGARYNRAPTLSSTVH